jgi:hypothetical protein
VDSPKIGLIANDPADCYPSALHGEGACVRHDALDKEKTDIIA